MPIPSEFQYKDEDEFAQNFLIPLLQRLGFSLVVNYHGHAEFGKDLIFAEVDRFGHVRYHAIQAKFEPSITLNEVEDLIRDCRQAFSNPFTHPQTGTVERISSFYAVNAGSLGPEAIQHYFNSLLPTYGGNARILQAKDLIVMSRWANTAKKENITGVLSAILLEIKHNRSTAEHSGNSHKNAINSESTIVIFNNLRLNAISSYLQNPILPLIIPTEYFESYWNSVSLLSNWINLHLFRGSQKAVTEKDKNVALSTYKYMEDSIENAALTLETSIQDVLSTLDSTSM